MAQSSQQTKPRKRAATARATPRRAREKRAAYRVPRWKIPNITPIGSDEPVSKTLPRAVKRIVETLHPEKIILFGSYAYGNPTPDSDVDLLVVMHANASSTERSWSVSRLLLPRPFPVDILVRTPKEIHQERTNGNFFVEEIYTQGKILYERSQTPISVVSKSRRRLRDSRLGAAQKKAKDLDSVLSRATMCRKVSQRFVSREKEIVSKNT